MWHLNSMHIWQLGAHALPLKCTSKKVRHPEWHRPWARHHRGQSEPQRVSACPHPGRPHERRVVRQVLPRHHRILRRPPLCQHEHRAPCPEATAVSATLKSCCRQCSPTRSCMHVASPDAPPTGPIIRPPTQQLSVTLATSSTSNETLQHQRRPHMHTSRATKAHVWVQNHAPAGRPARARTAAPAG